MRYAVPVINGEMAEHFGHCSHFALFDVDETTKTVVGREIVASPGHQPGLLPSWLAGEGVSVVIASGMGTRAQSLFTENHIEVVIGALGSEPEKAVMDYMRGTLATGGYVCDH